MVTNDMIINEIDGNMVENTETQNSEGGIGGAETNEIVEEENDEQKSQSELDIEHIKEKYSFIIPVTGTVTSRYGKRERLKRKLFFVKI